MKKTIMFLLVISIISLIVILLVVFSRKRNLGVIMGSTKGAFDITEFQYEGSGIFLSKESTENMPKTEETLPISTEQDEPDTDSDFDNETDGDTSGDTDESPDVTQDATSYEGSQESGTETASLETSTDEPDTTTEAATTGADYDDFNFEDATPGDAFIVTKPQSDSIDKYIFVGDSRTKEMSELSDNSQDVFIAEDGMGYTFLMNNLSRIYDEATSNSVVIIALGVNDMASNVNNYVRAINDLGEGLPCRVYYSLVTPVNEEVEEHTQYHVKNSTIDDFNRIMRANLSDDIIILDTNSFLKELGFNTNDGLHYDTDTNISVYNWIKNQLHG